MAKRTATRVSQRGQRAAAAGQGPAPAQMQDRFDRYARSLRNPDAVRYARDVWRRFRRGSGAQPDAQDYPGISDRRADSIFNEITNITTRP